MAEKLERIFEYRVLLSKAHELQIPLSPHEKARLARLQQQLPSEVPALDDRDAYTLLATPLPAQYVCGGRFGAGSVRNVSGGGLAIITSDPPELGQRLIVHVREVQHGIEYTFPCRIIARVLKGVPAIGVAFEGVPNLTRLGGHSSGVWRTEEPTTTANRPRVPGKRHSA